ncbi:hypothetical protein [Chryseobacterium caseinilyticum]|uniref:Uncharacterized protein n=1 Tax=Chryseobacterium caseinilyticum TaxID=2771428 RepID=A0ABR8ZFN5_9FLAO|nr:hypothetical protein [Chryseobacterium caseinilyticum]MBD8084090.1 hypothetical protein [Chryseobacterium caseinilyticum]
MAEVALVVEVPAVAAEVLAASAVAEVLVAVVLRVDGKTLITNILYSVIFTIFTKNKMMSARKSFFRNLKSIPLTPETESAFVRVAHKISSSNSKSQVVKIGNKFFRVKELG